MTKTKERVTQREIAEEMNFSVGTVNNLIKGLTDKGFIKNEVVTRAGWNVLEPYKVKNAIITAAGMSSRFAPLSYEKPKALLNVNLVRREQVHMSTV